MPKLTDAEWAAKRKLLQIAAGDDGWPTLGEIRNARWIEALWLMVRELDDRNAEHEKRLNELDRLQRATEQAVQRLDHVLTTARQRSS